MQNSSDTCDLKLKSCKPCEGGMPPMGEDVISEMLTHVMDWKYEGGKLCKSFKFKDYYETISFVNAVAWISNRQGHHPDMEVGYDSCKVCYMTHAIGGLSENDFICAAKLDELI